MKQELLLLVWVITHKSLKTQLSFPDTDEGLDKAGRAAEMAYQVLKIAKEQKLDIEKALFDNNKYEVGSASAARELAGCGAYVSS